MELTEAQKKKIIQIVKGLETHPVFDSCEDKVFDFEDKGITWQLQVKVVQDPDDFI